MSSELQVQASSSPALTGDTFLRAPHATARELRPGDIAVIGVPHDVTKISRSGARMGPRAIREATLMFDFAVERMAAGELVDIDADRSYRYHKDRLRDLGDLDLAADPSENFDRIRAAVAEVVSAGATPLILGGDHFITYPSVAGLVSSRPDPLAYFHIDMHLDLADDVPGFGRLASGTPIRRLVDDQVLSATRIVIVGVESIQHRNEWTYAQQTGIEVVSATQLRDPEGPTRFRHAIERVMSDAEAAYISFDIDALSRTYAPGTGNAVGASGLRPDEVSDLLKALRNLPIAGLDLVEVAPNWDPTGRTAGLGASLLIEALWPVLFEGISQ